MHSTTNVFRLSVIQWLRQQRSYSYSYSPPPHGTPAYTWLCRFDFRQSLHARINIYICNTKLKSVKYKCTIISRFCYLLLSEPDFRASLFQVHRYAQKCELVLFKDPVCRKHLPCSATNKPLIYSNVKSFLCLRGSQNQWSAHCSE